MASQCFYPYELPIIDKEVQLKPGLLCALRVRLCRDSKGVSDAGTSLQPFIAPIRRDKGRGVNIGRISQLRSRWLLLRLVQHIVLAITKLARNFENCPFYFSRRQSN